MGRKSASGGVQAKGRDRIEFTFKYEGKRYRPTIRRTPTTANLRRARIQLEAIKLRIEAGTFSFVEEFPDYRFQNNLAEVHAAKGALPTCRSEERRVGKEGRSRGAAKE